MGEYADMEIERWIGDSRWGRQREKRPARIVTCRHCGTKDLRFGQIKGGATVLNNRDGSRHECPLPKHRPRLDCT